MRQLLLAALLAASLPALADEDSAEKAQARVLLGQGNALFEHGDLKGALVDFRAAYSLYPSPKLLVNCAAAARELGELSAAANDLRHYLDDAAEDDPVLTERARADLKSLERRLGRVAFSAWPARSTFEVDGRPGRDPTYVKPGTHHVRARTPGGEASERDVDVGAGEVTEVGMVARGSDLPPVTWPSETKKRRGKGWVAGLVIGILASGAAVALGVTLGMPPAPQALKGDLGTYKFSDFH